jgi:hypothetical protein
MIGIVETVQPFFSFQRLMGMLLSARWLGGKLKTARLGKNVGTVPRPATGSGTGDLIKAGKACLMSAADCRQLADKQSAFIRKRISPFGIRKRGSGP